MSDTVNIGESVVDLSVSDQFAEYNNVELSIDDETSLSAKFSGEAIVGEDGFDKWLFDLANADDSVTRNKNSFTFIADGARDPGEIACVSSPALATYRQLEGNTLKINFTVSSQGSRSFFLTVLLGVRANKDAENVTPLDSKNLATINVENSFTYSVKFGEDYISQYRDGYIGLYLLLRTTQACEVTVSDISAKVDGSNTLVAKCPWATPAIAENILKRLKGFQYSPFEATGARINPAAEVGDNVTIKNGEYSLFAQDTRFGSEFVSNISAPGEKELEHEFEYVPSSERTFKRTVATLRSEIDIRSGEIRAEVEKKVSSENQSETFGWTLQSDNFTLYSNGQTVMRADKDGIKVTGEINATSGVIGGCEIRDGKLIIASANIGNISAKQITVDVLDAARIPTINSTKLADNCVIPRTISDGAITTGKIYGGAVTASKIGGGAVSMDKLSSDVRSTVGSAARLFGANNGYSMPRITNPIISGQFRWNAPSVGGGGRSYILGLADSKPANAKLVVAYQV